MTMQEDFIPSSFASRVLDGLRDSTKCTLDEARRRRRHRDPMLDLTPQAALVANPVSMPGPGSFGPVSVGGIMRHS